LLQNFLGFRIEKPSDLSRVIDLLEAFKKWERQLRTMKNKDLRNLGLSKRRTKAEEPCDPDPIPPKRQAMAIARWCYFLRKIGEPLPMEDRVQWARDQLKDEPNLS